MDKQVGRGWLISSGILFAIYCMDVAVGKIALATGGDPLFSLGDVGEFLLLFASVICLVVTVLEREAIVEKTQNNN